MGYIIDSRMTRVIWPEDKVQALKNLLHDWLHNVHSRSPSQIAKLLGFVRHDAFFVPIGKLHIHSLAMAAK
jgi:hypothetical protein